MATKAEEVGHRVCVTGAGGFVGSWVVKELLLRGYVVRATARDPSPQKYPHLQTLEGAEDRLSLCYANIMDYNSLRVAFDGCQGVFHVASPVSNDPQLVSVAVEGSKNVINAAADLGVRRVVFTSSYGAVHMDPNRSPDTVMDETCWSDLDFCKRKRDWYSYGKVVAEKTAVEQASRRGIRLLSVVPPVTAGRMLQPTTNVSSHHFLHYLNGAKKDYPNAVAAYVDVRDVARAHALVYEDPGARGRYLCVGAVLHRSELLRCEDSSEPMIKPYKFSNQKLTDLGLEFTPIRESLFNMVLSLQEKGDLPAMVPRSSL
ncbi:cinnamoyl-CoA reductase 1-like isoform X2 [Oryza brachyantha]|uniref:cinnamoyl-CoA reductase 1-like isoform X2 n=1 Tax=Oryza brachyantha TaxID=4533 RepID=UPI0007767CBA|nr:cinnamoyl-CoA reductase 1-like isoform X2 [Oryza brachyantha]